MLKFLVLGRGENKMKKIKLSNSVKIDGVEVHELNLRTPKVRDLIAASKKKCFRIRARGEFNCESR